MNTVLYTGMKPKKEKIRLDPDKIGPSDFFFFFIVISNETFLLMLLGEVFQQTVTWFHSRLSGEEQPGVWQHRPLVLKNDSTIVLNFPWAGKYSGCSQKSVFLRFTYLKVLSSLEFRKINCFCSNLFYFFNVTFKIHLNGL